MSQTHMAGAELFETIESERERLEELTQEIWETPELGLHETESAAVLVETLEDEGFDVETGVGGMPTAFVAEYGEGGPRVGILGEYDALPGLSQDRTTDRKPIEAGGPGHGCGHNLYGVGAVGAAIGVARAIDRGDVDGTIVCYGCPAEETLIGKTYMARAGVFDDLDAALTWHPGDVTRPWTSSSNAMNSIMFNFEGTAAHAAGSPESGRSAADAVQLLNIGVEHMREHMIDDARIHYTVTNGGQAPNVVPADASVWYYVRAPTRDDVDRLTEWVRDIANGAAVMAGVDVNERFLTGCYDYLANEPVTDALWENLDELGRVGYDSEDEAFAAELQETISEENRQAQLGRYPTELRERIEDEVLFDEPVPAIDDGDRLNGSTEVGDVSWITPTAQIWVAAWPVGTPGHTWQIVAANGDYARKAAVYAAKAMGGAAADLMNDPERLERAREEFEAATGGREYETPLPPEAEPPFDVTRMGPVP